MQYPEGSLIDILKQNSVDFICTLPCEKISILLEQIKKDFFHIPLTREEEGVGISAGIALAGKRSAMFVQSSGIGNMINALLSLTGFYELPLAIFVSQRGIYKEKIPAQLPMGQRLPGILKAANIAFSTISTRNDFRVIEKKLPDVYRKNKIHIFLLSPALFENSKFKAQGTEVRIQGAGMKLQSLNEKSHHIYSAKFTRFEILKIIAPYLDSRIVICNLGIPSKELFQIKHQPSNFYMLGSMGMATPIGLGISIVSDKDVIVIEGDGSLLMNPGTLATAAHFAPPNLTIVAIDNSSYGSTGGQPTLTASCVDLAILVKGFGITNVVKAAGEREFIDAFRNSYEGLKFIHALAVPGNENVPDIPLHYLEVKKQVMDFIKK